MFHDDKKNFQKQDATEFEIKHPEVLIADIEGGA
jgi:hypothetical protein